MLCALERAILTNDARVGPRGFAEFPRSEASPALGTFLAVTIYMRVITKLLKRHFPAVILTFIFVAAYFQSRGATRLLGFALGLDRVSSAPPPRDSVAEPNASLHPRESTELSFEGDVAEGDVAPRQAALFEPQPLLPPQSQPRPRPRPPTLVPMPVVPQAQAVSSSPLAQLRSVRVLPEARHDTLIGVRLYGIRDGSLLAALGLKNGDLLESINGFEVASPAKAFQAYARLRVAQRLHLQLERSGHPLEIDLNID